MCKVKVKCVNYRIRGKCFRHATFSKLLARLTDQRPRRLWFSHLTVWTITSCGRRCEFPSRSRTGPTFDQQLLPLWRPQTASASLQDRNTPKSPPSLKDPQSLRWVAYFL